MEHIGTYVYVTCDAEGCDYDLGVVASFLCDLGTLIKRVEGGHKLAVWVESSNLMYNADDHTLSIASSRKVGHDLPEDIQGALTIPISLQ